MIDIIDTDAALHALAPEWHALWSRTEGATPFASPHWLLPWWRHFGTAMPRVAIERGLERTIQIYGGSGHRALGGLRAVLPLYVLPQERKALPIGAGPSDYLDALGNPAALLPPLLERLQTDPIDSIDLIDLPPGSRLPHAPLPPGWTVHWGEGSACPVLLLPGIPAKARRQLRLARNRAERAGGWTVETADAATLSASLDTLVRLHQRRWTAQGEAGVLADPALRAFLADAAASLQAAGLLRLQLLRVGDTVAAIIFALVSPGRLYFFLSGFDADFEYVSPGALLVGAMLEHAIAEGRVEAHFLRGRERYKYTWGAIDRFSTNGRLTPPARAAAA